MTDSRTAHHVRRGSGAAVRHDDAILPVRDRVIWWPWTLRPGSPCTAAAAAVARRAAGARRQHPLRHLPRAGPVAAPAGHGRDRRDARPAPEHRAPAPRPHARGRPARGHRPTPAARSAARSTATRWPPTPRRSGSSRRRCRCSPAWCWRWPSASAPARPTPSPSARPRGRPGRPATTTPRRRSRRWSPTSTGSASTPIVADARRHATPTPTPSPPSWRSPTARSPTSPATIPTSSARLHRGLVAGLRRPDGRRRGRRVLPARPPHALPGVGDQPLALTSQRSSGGRP